MENIILSLLLLKAMTIYEMRSYIQKNLSAVCSDSLGSIQTAIKKLLEKGLIDVTEIFESSMQKKQYSITATGLDFYKSWTGTPVNLQKMKSMEEGKIFFLGMAAKEKRVSFLEKNIKALHSELEKLQQIKALVDSTKKDAVKRNVSRLKNEPDVLKNLLMISEEKDISITVNNIYSYQLYMLDYGLARMQSDIDFYRKLLQKEVEGKK